MRKEEKFTIKDMNWREYTLESLDECKLLSNKIIRDKHRQGVNYRYYALGKDTIWIEFDDKSRYVFVAEE